MQSSALMVCVSAGMVAADAGQRIVEPCASQLVRDSAQAMMIVPWHGRQTMETEDDSNPEDDA
jgi:hypothetical protein